MNLHIIACQVFYREISCLASPSPHRTWTAWLPQGMHSTPHLLREAIQREIDRVDLHTACRYITSELSRMLHDVFREEVVLMRPPGRTIQPGYDDGKIRFV